MLTSLIGYLKWGGGNAAFLFEAEVEVLTRAFTEPMAVLHLFTALPFIGQVLLIVTLFQRIPNRMLTLLGLAGLAPLLLFVFLIGILSLEYRIILSTLPFVFVAGLVVRSNFRKIHLS